jgi:hypothetical protein
MRRLRLLSKTIKHKYICNIAEKIFKPKMMKNKNVKLFMIWLLIFLVITTLTFLTKELTELGKNMWVMLPAYFAILILGCNLPQGFVLMPNDPPHFGIVTRLGRRLWKRHPDAGKVIRGKGIIPKDSKTTVILTEGWNWIPFRRILYGVRMINMSKRSIDLDPQTLITPDQVTTDVPIAIAYTPCQEHIINLLDLGIFAVGMKVGDGEGMIEDRRYEGALKYFAQYGEEEFLQLLKHAGFSVFWKTVRERAAPYQDKPILEVLARRS